MSKLLLQISVLLVIAIGFLISRKFTKTRGKLILKQCDELIKLIDGKQSNLLVTMSIEQDTQYLRQMDFTMVMKLK